MAATEVSQGVCAAAASEGAGVGRRWTSTASRRLASNSNAAAQRTWRVLDGSSRAAKTNRQVRPKLPVQDSPGV